MYERSGGWKAYRAGVTGSGSPPKPSGSPVEMEGRRLGAAARCLREGIGEATTYLLPEFPAEHRRRIRTNNMFYGRGSRDWRYCWVLAWFRRVRAVVRRVVGDVRR